MKTVPHGDGGSEHADPLLVHVWCVRMVRARWRCRVRGRIEYRPASHGVWEGALRGQETVTAKITDGDAERVELTPGPWRVRVIPDVGTAWDTWLIEIDRGHAGTGGPREPRTLSS